MIEEKQSPEDRIDFTQIDKCPICGMDLNQKLQVLTCGNVTTGVFSPNGEFKVEGKVECPYNLQ